VCDREEVYGLAGLTRRRGDAKKTGAGTFLSPQTHRKTEQGKSMSLSAWQSGSGGASLRVRKLRPHPLAKRTLEWSGRAERRRSFQPRMEHREQINLPKRFRAALATALQIPSW